MRNNVAMRTGMGLALVVLAGCAEIGSPPMGALPPDVHARPDPIELAQHPCRYGEMGPCIAKCQDDDPQACNAAGVLFEFDGGDRSDPELAAGFYRRACDGNYGP